MSQIQDAKKNVPFNFPLDLSDISKLNFLTKTDIHAGKTMTVDNSKGYRRMCWCRDLDPDDKVTFE
ncbi:MAG: hypothetical protein HQK79_10325 [Desulfobacterales bacterium]|nr:hypothetical protein [Desulfobacterales bacterium]MBF0398484.1 hypothetical protein [Desulfobacterales bacterium]